VDALQQPDGWWRDTAGRLIYQRQDKSVVPLLEKLAVKKDSRPAARAAALWALAGVKALRVEVISDALKDESPDVREVALRVAESAYAWTPELIAQILAWD